jgi:hypothetical protein
MNNYLGREVGVGCVGGDGIALHCVGGWAAFVL